MAQAHLRPILSLGTGSGVVGGFLALTAPQRIERRLVLIRTRIAELERRTHNSAKLHRTEARDELLDLKDEAELLQGLVR